MPPKGLPEAVIGIGMGFQRLNAYGTGIPISGVTFCITDLLQKVGQNFGPWVQHDRMLVALTHRHVVNSMAS